ncbi:MAG: MFS transporter [Lachnospiraceae bacterium]|nr:MFS transporter [Lachnospiraceae bacterium]
MDFVEKKIDLKLILSVVATGILSFAGVVVEMAMNITFPTLIQEFRIGTSTVQWLTTGYLLMLALIIPTSSWMKKNFKTKNLFCTAMTLFLCGTLLALLAPSFWLLLAGRVIQGIGTGIALPLMFNIVLEQVPEENMGFMMGVATLITAMAPAVGPSFGGAIATVFGWRMIFAVLIPVLLIAFAFGIIGIRQVSKVERTSFPLMNWALLAISFSGIIFAASFASEMGWLSVPVMALLFIAAVALVLFYKNSVRLETPLVDVSALKDPVFTLNAAVIFLNQFICLGLGFLMPNLAQISSGYTAFTAGLLFLPGCVIGAALSPVSGRIMDRFGARIPILTGDILIFTSAFCFYLFAGNLNIKTYIGFYLFFTIGQAFAVGPSMTTGLKHLPEALNTDGNAIINTMQQLAGAIGTSVVTTLVAAAQGNGMGNLAENTVYGTKSAFALLAVLGMAMIGIFMMLIRKKSI